MNTSLQALADPSRRRIVELLLARELPVGELVEALPIAQSGVSRHLRILREAGMVRCRAEGQRRLYALQPEPFAELSDWLAEVRRHWDHSLDRFEMALAQRQSPTPPETKDET